MAATTASSVMANASKHLTPGMLPPEQLDTPAPGYLRRSEVNVTTPRKVLAGQRVHAADVLSRGWEKTESGSIADRPDVPAYGGAQILQRHLIRDGEGGKQPVNA